MNRPIMFRAWDKNSGTMFYGVESSVAFDDGSHYGFENFLNPSIGDCHDWIVMQFTGLKDKNGKMIWEGDVVEYEPKCRPTEVFYDQYIGAWQPFAATHYPVTDWTKKGNIHENPELL